MEPVVIPDWRGHRTFHPELTARVAAPRDEVVASLAATLRSRGLRLGYEGPDGFRATYRSWWDVLGWLQLDFYGFTRVRVVAVPDGTGTSVRVAVEEDGGLNGRKPCVAALSAAFQELQKRGVDVTVTSWSRPVR